MNNQAAATQVKALDAIRRGPSKRPPRSVGLFQMDRIPEADQVTQAIINTGVASPDILYYRARLFDEHGQTKEAITSLKAACRSAADSSFTARMPSKCWRSSTTATAATAEHVEDLDADTTTPAPEPSNTPPASRATNRRRRAARTRARSSICRSVFDGRNCYQSFHHPVLHGSRQTPRNVVDGVFCCERWSPRRL